MRCIEIIQISLLFVVCAIASMTDLSRGKIQNKLILVTFIIGGIGDVVLYGFYYRDLLSCFAGNAALLAAIAIALYALRIWAGGDSKLLLVIAAVYPAGKYWEINGGRFSLWILLAFTFCAGCVYVIIDTIVCFVKARASFDRKRFRRRVLRLLIVYMKSLLYLSALSFLYALFLVPLVPLPAAVYLVICVLFVLLINSFAVFDRKALLIAVLAFDILMSFMMGYVPVSVEWRNYLFAALVLVFKALAENYNYQTIHTEDIRPGMILSRVSSALASQSRVKGLPEISDESLKSRLTEEEADSIRRWGKTKQGPEQIVIVRKIPFAIFIFTGFISYVIVGGLFSWY